MFLEMLRHITLTLARLVQEKTCSTIQPEALKSLYRSPGNKKKPLVLCKNYVLRHLGITINIKNTKFVKDLPMIDAQFRFNQCNSFREENISVFSHMVLCKYYDLWWQPSWISDRHKKPKLCRGPSNDYSWAVWFQLSKWFQRGSILRHFSHRFQC